MAFQACPVPGERVKNQKEKGAMPLAPKGCVHPLYWNGDHPCAPASWPILDLSALNWPGVMPSYFLKARIKEELL